MAPAGYGKTISCARIPRCSCNLLGCNSLHDRICVHSVAETIGLQPWEHPRRHPGLLHLVVFPAPEMLLSLGYTDLIDWRILWFCELFGLLVVVWLYGFFAPLASVKLSKFQLLWLKEDSDIIVEPEDLVA